MGKYFFAVFLLCGLLIVVIGLVFLLMNESTWFLLDGEGPMEYRDYGGKEIIIMGVAMVLFGLLAKRWTKKQVD